MSPEWFTVPEVAEHLRVDPTTIRRWISLGLLSVCILPHAGHRRVYRIHHSTLDALLSTQPPEDHLPLEKIRGRKEKDKVAPMERRTATLSGGETSF